MVLGLAYFWVDKSVLKTLNFNDKLTYLKERAKLIFLDSLREILYLEGNGGLAKYHLLNMTSVICLAIEGLGHFLTGTDQSWESFKLFVSNFMHQEFQRFFYDGRTYSRMLWDDFRNGLAHGFYIKKGGIERNKPWYFRIDDKIGLQINFDELFLDFENAFEKFFRRLQSDGENSQFGDSFKKRFEALLEKY